LVNFPGVEMTGSNALTDQAFLTITPIGRGRSVRYRTKTGGHMSSAKTTTDHELIRRWVEERGGHPARVKGTGKASDKTDGLLRIDFAEPTEGLERITWYDFFQAFEENKLALLYQDERDSRFVKLVGRD
jgi:hypothetical protein